MAAEADPSLAAAAPAPRAAAPPLPAVPLAAWAFIGLPVAALGLPLVVYLPPYYAGTLGLPLATVGFLFALVRLVDIPLDPLLGALMDNGRSRFGQFRPWIVAGAFFLAAGCWLLFMAEPGVTAPAAFLALFTLYLGFSLTNLAQVSWGSRLSGDYAERARIFGAWTAANVFGTMVILFVPPVLAALDPASTPADGVRAMGWFVIALVPVVVTAAALLVPEGEAPAGHHKVRFADVARVLKDRRMARLLVVDLLLSIAPGIAGALFLFFFTAARGFSPVEASGMLLFYFIAGLVAAPFWIRLARRWGKHRATALAALLLGGAQFGLLFIPPEPRWLAAIAITVAGLPFAAPAFLLRAMMADLNDAQALDRRRAGFGSAETIGLNFAILTATQKLGYALPVGLAYPLLGAIGFDARPGAANSADALRGLELLFVTPPALFCAAAALLIWRWPITADAHALIRAALAPSDAPPSAPAG